MFVHTYTHTTYMSHRLPERTHTHTHNHTPHTYHIGIPHTGDDAYELEAKTPEYAKDWVQHIETALALLRQTPLFIYY